MPFGHVPDLADQVILKMGDHLPRRMVAGYTVGYFPARNRECVSQGYFCFGQLTRRQFKQGVKSPGVETDAEDPMEMAGNHEIGLVSGRDDKALRSICRKVE